MASDAKTGLPASAVGAGRVAIVQGRIALSFHLVAAEIVKYVLEALGVEVSESEAPHEAMFKQLEQGKVDLLIGWPGSHHVYYRSYESELEALGTLYEPYCIWGVPDYVPSDVVSSVLDLLKNDVLAKMNRCIQGINAGAGISRFSQTMIEQYKLGQAGYYFQAGTQNDCFSAFENALHEKKWCVVPLWHPQYLHHRHSIRPLADPQGLLGPRDRAVLFVRKEASKRLPPTVLDALKRIYIGNKAVTEMDYLVNVEKMDPRTAALAWIQNNRTTVDLWLAASPEERLQLLGITVPVPPPAVTSSYEPFRVASNGLIFTSLQLPYVGAVMQYRGRIGESLNVDDGYSAARLCAINVISQLKCAADGDLRRIRLLRVEGHVQGAFGFKDSPQVLNGASDLLNQVFQNDGKHCRLALHHVDAPLDAPVMIAVTAELKTI